MAKIVIISFRANKTTHCADMIAQYYNRYAGHKDTQFVFSDLGTYKPDQWNPYSEIKRKLVEDHGIPEDQIRFIQEAKTEKKRKAMIEAMNEGRDERGAHPRAVRLHRDAGHGCQCAAAVRGDPSLGRTVGAT